ncbi:MAG: hypothetical protein WA919_24390 [Coleofasciculaceae cyanobacterium]
MRVEDLPLFELFTRLREAGLPLGLDEYQLLLRSLQAGFGLPDRAALARLCCRLWVKSAEEQQIFDYHFQEVMGQSDSVSEAEQDSKTDIVDDKLSPLRLYIALGLVLTLGLVTLQAYSSLNKPKLTETVELTTPTPEAPPTTTPTPEPTATQIPQAEATQETVTVTPNSSFPYLLILTLVPGLGVLTWLNKRRASKVTESLPAKLTRPIEDEIQVYQAVRQVTNSNRGESDRFLLKKDYFPVTRREMKQSWRYLRRLVREGTPTELDVEATVREIGRQGILLKPVFVPRRVNRTELLLLIDQGGSMVPFHTLSQRLVETAMQGGGLSAASIYYFHNCPSKYLYRNRACFEAEAVNDILQHLSSQHAGVLIFSDGGAACGGLNKQRGELTGQFLDQLRSKVRYMAWLNPMPRSRWVGTTAGEIAGLVPMFEFSRQGLDGAIGVLRGKM